MSLIKKIFFVCFVAVTLWGFGYACFLASIFMMKAERPNDVTDAIVVLTGGKMRIETGLELFAKGRAGHLFITGVHPDVHKYEITQKWKGDIALPPCCITLGHMANTTQQNADETKEWLKDKDFASIRLITADFHMNRSLVEFRNRLPDIDILTHPVAQPNVDFKTKRFWELSFVEYHKTVFRWLRLLLPSFEEASQ